MKILKSIVVLAIAIIYTNGIAQEKKIKFNKGTLKICSSKNFKIEGYDGNEVIIKSLHEKRGENATFVVNGYSNSPGSSYSYSSTSNGKLKRIGKAQSISSSSTGTSKNGNVIFFNNDSERKKGLKKLGEKNQNSDLGIYFTIEQKGEELIFRDQQRVGLLVSPNEKYSIKIPNSIKLNWKTKRCSDQSSESNAPQAFFYSSKASSLSNFSGEVEIASSLKNIKLTDVTGPVVINTLGGNVTVEFEKKYPNALYSIYSNNGFIDIQIPEQSNLLVDVIGKSVYSDVDFKVLEEEEVNDVWQTTTKMKLKYGTGKVKMKLNGGFGNVYLRKNK